MAAENQPARKFRESVEFRLVRYRGPEWHPACSAKIALVRTSAKDWQRAAILAAVIAAVALLHYNTPVNHVWIHPLLQRAYYIPILLAALWFGWRGGLAAATLSGASYIPHIVMAWNFEPQYKAAQYIEIGMFFAIAALTGVLADHERAQRHKVEETARRLSEVYTQLQKSFEQLRRADRMSALGELSAGLAHEVRNPLGSIEGAVQILGRRDLEESTRQEFTEMASREVVRLKGLLTHFLEFARPQQPRVVASDIELLLQSVAKLSGETAKMARVDILVESASTLPQVAIDPEQIRQVLLNLVINAIQAMPNPGQIRLRAIHEGENVRIEIEDEGIGIPADDVERIFDPFFTTRSDGTGLGLSIAYQIVSQHGGHITAKRNPERGMTFTVTLPLAASTAEPTLARS